VVRPEVLAQLVGYDCKLVELRRRLKCRMCGTRWRVRVETARPDDRQRGIHRATRALPWHRAMAEKEEIFPRAAVCALDGLPKFNENVVEPYRVGEVVSGRDCLPGRQLKICGNG
jgi:hypothetical protein